MRTGVGGDTAFDRLLSGLSATRVSCRVRFVGVRCGRGRAGSNPNGAVAGESHSYEGIVPHVERYFFDHIGIGSGKDVDVERPIVDFGVTARAIEGSRVGWEAGVRVAYRVVNRDWWGAGKRRCDGGGHWRKREVCGYSMFWVLA